MTLDELRILICSDKNKSGSYSRESVWKNTFSEFYNDLQSWTFPSDFKFTQMVYHYINNDPDLLLGLCKVCGKRSMFINIKRGYASFCSTKCANNSPSVKLKKEQTCVDHLGVKYPAQSSGVREKFKQTCLERYGYENPSQVSNVRTKIKQTCIDRFGVSSILQSSIVRDQVRQTCISRFGNEYPLQSASIREKSKETCLDKYGDEHYMRTDEFREKYKQACLEKYGVENPSQSRDVIEKIYETKKANNTFNTSKIEEQLKQYFTDNNINFIHQYRSDKYPFSCDFYFPDKDLYVEIHGSWTHGFHPYTGSEEDLAMVDRWKSKSTAYYDNAIETWTIRDVKKRDVAKQNSLNYIEIFSIDLETCIYTINNFIK